MRLDLLYLMRLLRRSPASAVAAVLTLALTLGTGASIFALVDAVLLTPPPFASPHDLVTIGTVPEGDPTAAPRGVRYATYADWRTRADALASLEAFDGTNLTMTQLGAAERLSATDVTPGFLPLLGVAPARGRTFDAADLGQPVAIVSHAFWQGRLGGDTAVIGRTIVLGGQAHTIVGVLPDGFVFALNACDIWRPIPLSPAQADRAGYLVLVVARLRPGVPPSRLETELDGVGGSASPPMRVIATRIATAMAGDSASTLMLLGAAAAIAVLIAFTNLGGLLIVRSIDRRRELAVRVALGARRSEIAKQLVLEAEALAVLGIAGGVLLALWITPATGRLAVEQFGRVAAGGLTLSWRVVGLVAMCALVCAGVCGCVPALASAHRIDVDALRRGATPSKREVTLRRVFVGGEVAIACALLVSMMVVGRSLLGVLAVNPGFDARGVLTLHLSLPAAVYPDARAAQFYAALQRALLERLGPGTVSTIDELPLTGDRGRFVVRARQGEAGREAVVRTAAAGYFDVMRIPLAAGRPFDGGDDAAAPRRAVVSETFAAQMFPAQNAIGRHVFLGTAAQPLEIVGVVGDVKHRALDEGPLPTLYLSALQSPSRSSLVVIRSARPDADLIAAVREEAARLDGNLPVYGTRAMADVVSASPGVPARRVLTATFVMFALLAVALGTIGLFGVAAHDVARRRQELALRIALGADPMRIVRATLAQGAWIVGAGLAAGAVLSMWAARALDAFVVSRQALDVASIGIAAVILAAAGLGALLPVALRAARIDPISALRSE